MSSNFDAFRIFVIPNKEFVGMGNITKKNSLTSILMETLVTNTRRLYMNSITKYLQILEIILAVVGLLEMILILTMMWQNILYV